MTDAAVAYAADSLAAQGKPDPRTMPAAYRRRIAETAYGRPVPELSDVRIDELAYGWWIGAEPWPTQTKPQAGRDAKGRFATLNAFVDSAAGRLTRAELLVWLILFRDAKASEGRTARTSQGDIARRAGLRSKRTVQLAIDSLQAKGLLSVIAQGGLRRGPSRYRVTANPPP